jgi:hypothetical protein
VTQDVNFWMSSIAMDKLGDIRTWIQRFQRRSRCMQQASFHRQGDYGSMRVDPQHGCTLRYTQEYYLISRPFHWSTPTSGFYINDTERLHVQTPMSFAPCRLTKTL